MHKQATNKDGRFLSTAFSAPPFWLFIVGMLRGLSLDIPASTLTGGCIISGSMNSSPPSYWENSFSSLIFFWFCCRRFRNSRTERVDGFSVVTRLNTVVVVGLVAVVEKVVVGTAGVVFTSENQERPRMKKCAAKTNNYIIIAQDCAQNSEESNSKWKTTKFHRHFQNREPCWGKLHRTTRLDQPLSL